MKNHHFTLTQECRHEVQHLKNVRIISDIFSPLAITLHYRQAAWGSDSHGTQTTDNNMFLSLLGHSNLVLSRNLELMRPYPLPQFHHEPNR
jgi:hypothetical protein